MAAGLHRTGRDSEGDARRLLALYQVSEEDLEHVRELGRRIGDAVAESVSGFYDWMTPLPEFREFFSDPELLERVKRLQAEYWREFLQARVDGDFIASRRRLGAIHARIGLPLETYLAGMNSFLICLVAAATSDSSSADPAGRAARVHALCKLLHLDTAIVVEEFNEITKQVMSEQSDALMGMSTPVTAIWSGILMLPIVGLIDSRRSLEIMNTMLAKIQETRARVSILDISGVGVVDTGVANHLIKVTKATKLMGCECIISGLSPSVAQTIIELGIDVGDVRTTATLQDALEVAFQLSGHEVHTVR